MLVALNAFDGWGSAMISGRLGAATALAAVWAAHRFEQGAQAKKERRDLADALIVELETQVEAVKQVSTGKGGEIQLASLWLRMADLQGPLGDRGVHAQVREVYQALSNFGQYAEHNPAASRSTEQNERLAKWSSSFEFWVSQLVTQRLTWYRSGEQPSGAVEMHVKPPDELPWGYDSHRTGGS